MNSTSCIYIVTPHPVFNSQKAPLFGSFNNEHSVMLYSSLLKNYKEVVSNIKHRSKVVYCLDEADMNFVSQEFIQDDVNLLWEDTSDVQAIIQKLAEKYFYSHSKNIIVFSNSIGISSHEFDRIFNLLSIEDEAVVIGKSVSDKVAYLGFNAYHSDLLKVENLKHCDYDKMLAQVSKHEFFINVLNNYLTIDNLDDFKNLYTELSKKESLNYCSQTMHERFTNLFIEYKELLK